MIKDILEFYETIGFEEVEIEDNLTALYCEMDEDGSYILLTDEDGGLPRLLPKPILFTYYSPEDSFLWSTSFKNSNEFKELWQTAKDKSDKLAAVKKYRDTKEWYQ